MPTMKQVERAIDADDGLAVRPHACRQRCQARPRHQTKVVEACTAQFLDGHGGGSELADDDAGRLVGQCDCDLVSKAAGLGQCEGGNHGIASTAHVEHLQGQRWHRQFVARVARAEEDAVRSQREQDVGAEFGCKRSSRRVRVLGHRFDPWQSEQRPRLAPIRGDVVAAPVAVLVLGPRIDDDLSPCIVSALDDLVAPALRRAGLSHSRRSRRCRSLRSPRRGL